LNSLRKTIDAAVILSIITGSLYVVGWSYWWTYFKYFGIRSNQINLSLYEVIVTTWWVLLPLILFYLLMEYLTDVERMDESNLYVSSILVLMNNFMGTNASIIYSLILLSLGAFLVVTYGTEGLVLITSLLIVIASIFIISIYFVGESLNNNFSIKNILLLLSLSSFYNVFSGYIVADRISNGNSGHKISIEHKSEELTFDDYIFISYMNGVYYIHKPKSERDIFSTIMIHEGNIESAKLSK